MNRTSHNAAISFPDPRRIPDPFERRGGGRSLDRAERIARQLDYGDTLEKIGKEAIALSKSKPFEGLRTLAEFIAEMHEAERAQRDLENRESGVRVLPWRGRGFIVFRVDAVAIGSRVALLPTEAEANAHAKRQRAESGDLVDELDAKSTTVVDASGLAMILEPVSPKRCRHNRIALNALSANAERLARSLVQEALCPSTRIAVGVYDQSAAIMKMLTAYHLARACELLEEPSDLPKKQRDELNAELRDGLRAWVAHLVQGGL